MDTFVVPVQRRGGTSLAPNRQATSPPRRHHSQEGTLFALPSTHRRSPVSCIGRSTPAARVCYTEPCPSHRPVARRTLIVVIAWGRSARLVLGCLKNPAKNRAKARLCGPSHFLHSDRVAKDGLFFPCFSNACTGFARSQRPTIHYLYRFRTFFGFGRHCAGGGFSSRSGTC